MESELLSNGSLEIPASLFNKGKVHSLLAGFEYDFQIRKRGP